MGIFTPLQICSLVDQYYYTITTYVENPITFQEPSIFQKRRIIESKIHNQAQLRIPNLSSFGQNMS